MTSVGEILHPGQLKQLEDAGYQLIRTENVEWLEQIAAALKNGGLHVLPIGTVPPWMERHPFKSLNTDPIYRFCSAEDSDVEP